jgi:hypothetical protein
MPHFPRTTPALALALVACTTPVEAPPPPPDAGPPALLPGPYTTSAPTPKARVLASIVPAPASGAPLPGAAKAHRLAYALREVRLCGGLTVTGDDFTSPQFCARAWEAPANPALDAAASIGAMADYARTADARLSFLDLLDPRARLPLRGRFTVGEDGPLLFSWGYAEWHPVARLSATAEVGGVRFATHDGATAEAGGRWVTTSAEPFARAGESGTAIVPLTRTRTWFKFAAPLRVEPGDVTAGRSLRVDLLFDADDLVLARTDGAGAPLVDPEGAGFALPPLELTAVPLGADDALWRETWTAPVPGAEATLKVSLYGRQGDEARRVLGMAAREVSWGAATREPHMRSRPVSASPDADGWTLQEPGGTAVVRRFARPDRMPAPGETIDAEVRCTEPSERPAPRGFVIDGCPAGAWRPVTFTAR